MLGIVFGIHCIALILILFSVTWVLAESVEHSWCPAQKGFWKLIPLITASVAVVVSVLVTFSTGLEYQDVGSAKYGPTAVYDINDYDAGMDFGRDTELVDDERIVTAERLARENGFRAWKVTYSKKAMDVAGTCAFMEIGDDLLVNRVGPTLNPLALYAIERYDLKAGDHVTYETRKALVVEFRTGCK